MNKRYITIFIIGLLVGSGIGYYISEQQRYKEILSFHGVIGRTATIVVAASNSSAKGKRQADYVCDGNNDQKEIQSAIDALPIGGGKIVLLEGTYKITKRVNLTRSSVTISGMGKGTTLEVQSDIFAFELSGGATWHMPDAQYGIVFENMEFTTSIQYSGGGILFDDSVVHSYIIGCYFTELDEGISSTPDSIGHGIVIERNYFDGNRISIYHCGGWHDIRIVNNKEVGCERFTIPDFPLYFIYSYKNAKLYEWIISHNSIEGIHDISKQSKAIYIYGAANLGDVMIECNSIEDADYAIVIDGSFPYGGRIPNEYALSNILISGNSLRSNRNNIYILDLSTALIQNNLFICYMGTDKGIEAHNFSGKLYCRNNQFFGFNTSNIFIASGDSIFHHVFDYSDRTQEIFMNCLPSSTTHIYTRIMNMGAEHEITTNITNPDVPRNLSVTTHYGFINSVTIEGIDAKGNSVSETIRVVPGGTAYGNIAFATVTKIIIPKGIDGEDRVSIGISDKLGLSNVIYDTADVYKIKLNDTDSIIGTVDTLYGTVDCAPINDGDDFTIYYKSNLNIWGCHNERSIYSTDLSHYRISHSMYHDRHSFLNIYKRGLLESKLV